jgi:soluble lytic murein transglycosylase-like protein
VQQHLKQVLMAQCMTALAFGLNATARADIWGYVDETGAARISTQKLDDRYQLFFKGGTTFEAPDAAADAQSRAAFERTPSFRRAMGQPNAGRFAPLIERYAELQHLDPALVKAVIAVESSFQPDAVSVKGAVGLMQIIPETGERYGIVGDATRSIEQKLRDPAINLRVGTRYLHDLLVLFADDLDLALAAYNAGENAVTRYDNTIPPFAETLEYVKLVQQLRSYYRPPAPATPKQVRIVVPGRRTTIVMPGDVGRRTDDERSGELREGVAAKEAKRAPPNIQPSGLRE